MEDYFSPGFKGGPFVHIGSQTLKFWHGIPEEQMFEGLILLAAIGKDIAVARDVDPLYISYWQSLVEQTHIVNLRGLDNSKYLSEVILENPFIIEKIRQNMAPKSKLMPFLVTNLEEKVANALGIPLYGSEKISREFGTKSGIRKLAKEVGIQMAPAFICSTYREIKDAVISLENQFDTIVLKHDLSASGYGSKKISIKEIKNLPQIINDLVYGTFVDGQEIIVVEGWIKNKASLCTHIEIMEGKEPIICGGWQQVFDKDGISYIGAGPLMLSPKARESFIMQTKKLAQALAEKGAIGVFGPDFIIASEENKNIKQDTCLLIELNARVPVTAFSLELIKHIKGMIGNGFCSTYIKLSTPETFDEIINVLKKEKLLITKRDTNAKGVVPFNIGMLPWKKFAVVGMADSWEEAENIIDKTRQIFERK